MDKRMPYVHSHPRSGTHLLAATLKRNFYAGVDVGQRKVGTGHWSSRWNFGPTVYAQMLAPGGHVLYNHKGFQNDRIHFYIYRDSRDVAVSLWNAKVLMHPARRSWSFSKFLRTKLDWYLTPGNRIRKGMPRWTVVEQWKEHLESWAERSDVFYVRYEQLVLEPLSVITAIAEHIGWEGHEDDFQWVLDKVGVAPGAAKVGTWRDVFSIDDLAYFHSIVPGGHWGLWPRRSSILLPKYILI